MKINSIFSRLCLGAAIAATGAVQLNADTINVFGNGTTDLSEFTELDGSDDAMLSVTGGGQLSVIDNDPGDAPEGYVAFDARTNGVRLEFDFEFNTNDLTVQNTNPEILVRFGNAGNDPDSNADTGFQLNLRHANNDTNQIRATNDTSSTSSGLGDFTDIADGDSFNVVALINNDTVAQDYEESGGGTVAAGTYDLFINGNLIGNYILSDGLDNDDGTAQNYDPTAGFGLFGINSSGSDDAGVEVLFDSVSIGLDEHNGFAVAVPEPSSAILLLSGLFSLGLIRRRN